jgi:signal transduction histidine kinase
MRERNALSLLIVPVMERGEVVGAIGLDSMERREFSDEEIALAQSVTAATGQAMETARLYQKLQRRTIELTRALEQRQELARLRSEFIRNVSHELRTPLAIARGHVELLESGVLGELEDEQRQSVDVIARRMRMLSQIMDDFAAIIDIEGELQRRPVDLAELMRELLTDRQTRDVVEQSNLTLTIEIAPDVSLVSGDAIQLQRAMSNLLNNAVKFTPGGGQVTVNLQQEGENLVLAVSDTGIGIPGDQFERIFERFYQIDGSTTRRYGGTGLGLALVKEIVELHGGQVTVQSLVDQGSTFTVILPICPLDLAPDAWSPTCGG